METKENITFINWVAEDLGIQPRKFKIMLFLIGFLIIFMIMAFWMSSLNSIPEEEAPKSYIVVNESQSNVEDNTGSNFPSPTWWPFLILGFIIWRILNRR